MVKLPNFRQSLDAIVAMPDGRRLGEAELVAVSDVRTTGEMTLGELFGPGATDAEFSLRSVAMQPSVYEPIDPKGVPWKAHVMKDWRVQQAAVAAGVIKKDSALPPHFALDLLRGNDPADDNYSVMGIIVPSARHNYGIKMIGIIRPDVVYFNDGEPHIKLWFNALMDPQYARGIYARGINRAYLTRSGAPWVTDFLVSAAMERMRPVAGDDALVFSDDQCSLSIGELVNGHGFKVLLENVQVSSLPEKRKSRLDTAVNSVTLLVKPSRAYANGMPPGKASEMVKDYLVDGYDAPKNGKLVGQALARLRAQTIQGLVQYR